MLNCAYVKWCMQISGGAAQHVPYKANTTPDLMFPGDQYTTNELMGHGTGTDSNKQPKPQETGKQGTGEFRIPDVRADCGGY